MNLFVLLTEFMMFAAVLSIACSPALIRRLRQR